MREVPRPTRPTWPRATLLDRAIGVLSPERMRDRLAARFQIARYEMAAGGYNAADRGRRALRNERMLDGAADSAVVPALPDLRVHSSDLVRNNALASGGLDSVVTKVVGRGLKLQALPDADALGLTEGQTEQHKKRAEALWAHLARRIDWQRRFELPTLEYLALHSALEFGDVGVVFAKGRNAGDLFDLKIQLVEAGRICNPDFKADSAEMAGGVEYDAGGRIAAYHVADRHPYDYGLRQTGRPTWTRIAAFGARSGRRNFVLLMMPRRVAQSRGVPVLAPVIETLKQLGQFTDAELAATVLASCFALTVHTESGAQMPTPGDPAAAAGAQAANPNRLGMTFEPGTVLQGLAPNEKIEGFAANRPNTAFDGFVLALTRQIALPLGLTQEVLIRHFTASYSASRAALLEVWEFMRRWRGWLAASLHQALYEEMLAEAVDRDLIACPGWEDPLLREAWSKARWIGPAPGTLNPLQEVEAARLLVESNFSTEEEQTSALTGGDYDANVAQRAREVKRNRDLGLDIEAVAERIRTEPVRPEGERRSSEEDDTSDDAEDETRQAS